MAPVETGAEPADGVATDTVTGVGENAGVDVGRRAGAGGVITGETDAGVGTAGRGGANGDAATAVDSAAIA